MIITKERLAIWMDYVRYQNHLSSRFSDCFFTSQLDSKAWLIESIEDMRISDVVIFGGWYGVLAGLLSDNLLFKSVNITTVDIDPECEDIVKRITLPDDNIYPVTGSMEDFEYKLTPDMVINTSCEHITQEQYEKWWNNIPINTWYVLQSNNFDIDEHIRTASSLEDFEKQCTDITGIMFKDEFETGGFTRYMIIGRK